MKKQNVEGEIKTAVMKKMNKLERFKFLEWGYSKWEFGIEREISDELVNVKNENIPMYEIVNKETGDIYKKYKDYDEALKNLTRLIKENKKVKLRETK